ncbi:hypothetical protein [Kibdelosporangium aridum]|uniref:hypothetical protein n=1 Tax=Kibdelosporangium aridum TaxID=2030 RepID=UPI0035E69514
MIEGKRLLPVPGELGTGKTSLAASLAQALDEASETEGCNAAGTPTKDLPTHPR